jgi:hypothetical protein
MGRPRAEFRVDLESVEKQHPPTFYEENGQKHPNFEGISLLGPI